MKLNFRRDPVDNVKAGIERKMNYLISLGIMLLTGLLYSCTSNDPTDSGKPVVTSFLPIQAVVGTEIAITGRNLGSATSVDFNGTKATITSVTQHLIKANVPVGAVTGKITVTTSLGNAVSPTDFSVKVLPSITSFSPTSAIEGTEITITGILLDQATALKFNGVSAEIKSKAATSLKANVPVGASSGKIEVIYADGSAFSATNFVVISTNPSVTSFSPASGPETTEVTIIGLYLDKVTSVKFNGISADTKTKTETSITVDVPAGATFGKISLVYAGGESSSADNFAVERQLLISDFEEPNSATDKWHIAQDGNEITVSEIVSADASADGNYFHLKGADVNGNYWLGGRYTENANSTKPFGVVETDATDVYFNVTVKSNNIAQAANQAKLVFSVYEAGQADNRRNWEIDFPVTWDTWKTISIRADKFHYWNGSGFTLFNGDVETMWSLALYITGGNTTTSEFSFDNVIISEGKPLGEVQNP